MGDRLIVDALKKAEMPGAVLMAIEMGAIDQRLNASDRRAVFPTRSNV